MAECEIYDTPAPAADSSDAAAKNADSTSGADSLHAAPDSAAAPDAPAPEADPRPRIRAGRGLGNLAELFNDSNHYQLLHAQRLGIEPITDLRSFYRTNRPLVKIVTNENLVIDKLTHSYPYLVPEAAALLDDIARNFRDSLRSKKAADYRVVVTSILRTPNTVRKLRRVNRNAVELSTHQFATTFDISYNHFEPAGATPSALPPADMKYVLAEVIRDLHIQGRCMVKYERKSPCFHITVAN